MAFSPVDPSSLQGEALNRWYLRSPDEIEQARQNAYAQRYADFFNQPQPADPDPGFNRGLQTPSVDIDPGFSRGMDRPTEDVDPGFSWVQVGPNKWRSVSASTEVPDQTPDSRSEVPNDEAILDKGLAGADDGGELIDVDSKARSQRRQWEQREGRPWPTTEAGRNYDRSHIIAKADGGPDTLENIRPQHPVEHMQDHMAKGDFRRWGAWGRGFKPPSEPTMNGLGLWQIPSDILGMFSGRIRTDSFDNFSSDMQGIPSQQDRRDWDERVRKTLFPGTKPGDKVA